MQQFPAMGDLLPMDSEGDYYLVVFRYEARAIVVAENRDDAKAPVPA